MMTSTEKFKQRYPDYPVPLVIEQWELLEPKEAEALWKLGLKVRQHCLDVYKAYYDWLLMGEPRLFEVPWYVWYLER